MSNTITPDTLLAQMRAMAAQAQAAQSGEVNTAEQGSFADLLKQSIDQVNDAKQTAKSLSDAFQAGDPNVKLPEVMVALEKSSVSFQAMLQVRNKIVSAYQDIMNMQV